MNNKTIAINIHWDTHFFFFDNLGYVVKKRDNLDSHQDLNNLNLVPRGGFEPPQPMVTST